MRIKLISLRGKKSITEVANEIGITRQMLGAIERGVRTPSLDLAYRISRYYKKSIENLFFD